MAQSIKRTKPIDSLVIHHTVVPGQDLTQAQAAAALNANQYAYDGKPPYHYIIGNTWDYQGRPYDTIGWHAGSIPWNDISIGIALMGNFNNDTPTAHQKKVLGEVIKNLMALYKIPRTRVFLHKQVRPAPTACPGEKITQDFISKLLMTEPMPTCDQLLVQEKKDHAESILEKNLNYEKWQTQLDRANGLEKKYQETYTAWQSEIEARHTAEAKITKAKLALE